jgi:hypothetical protein
MDCVLGQVPTGGGLVVCLETLVVGWKVFELHLCMLHAQDPYKIKVFCQCLQSPLFLEVIRSNGRDVKPDVLGTHMSYNIQ